MLKRIIITKLRIIIIMNILAWVNILILTVRRSQSALRIVIFLELSTHARSQSARCRVKEKTPLPTRLRTLPFTTRTS